MTDGSSDRGADPRNRPAGSRGAPRDGVDDGSDADGGDSAGEDGPALAGVLGAGEEDPDRSIEPGSPSLENAAFVLLGVLFACFVIYRAWAVFVGG